METKICRTCNIKKSTDDFSLWSGRKSLRPDCKRCIADKALQYRKENPEYYQKLKKQLSEKYHSNRKKELPKLLDIIGKIKICTKCGYEGPIENFKHNPNNKGSVNKVRLRGTCIPCANQRSKAWIENNPDKIKMYNKTVYNKRKKDSGFNEKKKEYQRVKLQTDMEVREKKRKRDRENKRTNPTSIMRRLLSNTIRQLGIERKTDRTAKLLGYTAEELFAYLGEKKNETDHIDHKVPMSWMKNNTPPNIACHLNNLCWKTKEENLSKNSHYADEISTEYFHKLKPYIKENFLTRFEIKEKIVYDLRKEIIFDRWSKLESCLD